MKTNLRNRVVRFSSMGITAMALTSAVASAQQTITLQSGNGAIGSADSQITYYSSGDGSIGPFTPADFAAAQNGPHATVVSAYPSAWITSLSGNPSANWIAVNSSRSPESALYAYEFQVTGPVIASASISLAYAVDNLLGEASVPGLYLNGVALPNSNGLGTFSQQFTYTDSNIGSLLNPGLNTLYFYQEDYGVVAGSIFSADIIVNAVPEPSTLALAGFCGLAALAAGISDKSSKCECRNGHAPLK